MGIKEKLPLLTSNHKFVRLSGYVVYTFMALIVLGAILPGPDVDESSSDTTSTSKVASTTPANEEIDCDSVKDELDRARTIYWQNGVSRLTTRQRELIDHCGTGRERDYNMPTTVKEETTKQTANSNQPTTKSSSEISAPTSAADQAHDVSNEPKSSVLDVASIMDMLPYDEKDAIVTVNTGDVSITREMKENINNDWMLRGAKIDSIDIFKSLFKDARVEEVTVTSTISLVDAYGQTSSEVGTVYTMSRATYQNINWDKFLTENLDMVADSVYIHPVFSR